VKEFRVPVGVKSRIKAVSQKYLQAGKSEMARVIINVMNGFYGVHEKFRLVHKKAFIEVIPAKEEIYRMADVSNHLRDEALVLCLFQYGVQPSCITNRAYSMVEKQLYPEITLSVALKTTADLDHKLSGHSLDYYCAFLQKEAAEVLKAYLDWRKAKGLFLKPNDLIFVSSTSTISGRKVIMRCGLSLRSSR